MRPERWAQIEPILEQALDRTAPERAALLDSVCGDDAELRREIDSLLAAHETAGLTEVSGFADAMKVLEHWAAKGDEGRTIGPYRILQEIGRGGMGTVYQAARADDAFRKLVAIKVIRRGLDTDDIIRRFRGERQILAMLDHTNIARLLDGGATEDGLPYFVMEYIDGEPIDVYAERRGLGVADRLKLFRGVCEAVSYAHRNLVIHRDIKPGNVLVTKDGVPRLVDFGIAKLIASPGTAETVTALQLLTPEFASPEQIRGEPLTTASDVYSLGVLLYVLLTGHRPYRGPLTSPAAIERAICEQEPDKPSAVAINQEPRRRGLYRQLQGDLDNIVLMALRKDPRRRYTSAEQLSADIEHYLANRPVAARPDTRMYRAAKFIRRNRALTSMAALTVLSLAGGIAASLWQTHVARQQRDVARLEQAKADRIKTFLQEMVGYSATNSPAKNHRYDATVVEMLDNAAQLVETELADQPEVKLEMLITIGGTYVSNGKIEPATRSLSKAYDLSLKLHGPDASKTGSVMNTLGDLEYRKGDYAAADRWLQKALAAHRRHVNEPDFEVWLLFGALSDAAFAKRALGQSDKAEALWREALSYAPRLSGKYRDMAPAPKTYLAQLYMERGDLKQADPLASAAVRELKALGNHDHHMAQSLLDLGTVRQLQGRYSEAEPLMQEGTKMYREVGGDTNPNVAYALNLLSGLHYEEGNYALAEQDALGALKIVEEKFPKGTSYYSAVYKSLARAYMRTGKPKDAERLLRGALEIQRKIPRPTDLAVVTGTLGECLVLQKRYSEAEPLLQESYDLLKSVLVPESPSLKKARERLDTLYAAWGRGAAPQ